MLSNDNLPSILHPAKDSLVFGGCLVSKTGQTTWPNGKYNTPALSHEADQNGSTLVLDEKLLVKKPATFSNTVKFENAVTGTQFNGDLNGNATSATEAGKLATECIITVDLSKINGTDTTFDGSDDIDIGVKNKLPLNSTSGNLSVSRITGTLPVANGGTGVTSLTAFDADITTKKTITAATIKAGTNITLTGSNGSISAVSYKATSDIRKKENITDFDGSDGSILDLPVKRFDFIDGKKNNIGCIAQDLQKICPELVHEEDDGYLSIEETKLIYLLLEEVKALKQRVDELENK